MYIFIVYTNQIKKIYTSHAYEIANIMPLFRKILH